MEKIHISSTEYFAALFRDFPDVISVNRLSDGECITVNNRFIEFTGYSSAKIGSWLSFKDWNRLVAEIRKNKQADRFETIVHAKSGSMYPVRLDARLISLENTAALLIVTRDVSEQRLLSETLLESDSQLQLIFENPATGIAFTDSKLNILRANRTMCMMFGYPIEEMIGQPVSKFTVPQDYAREEVLIQEIRQGHRDEYRLEKRSVAKDGRVFWTNVSVSTVRTADGKLRYLLGMINDIDNRKKAEELLLEGEEKYRTIFTAETDAIFLIDPDTNTILDANPAACQLYGYSLYEMVGMDFSDLSSGNKIVIREKQSQEELSLIQYHVKKNGLVFPVEISASLFSQQGRNINLVTVRDITERKRVEQERERLLAEVQQAHSQLQLLSRQLFEVQEIERRNIAYDLHDEIGQAILAIKSSLETLQLENESEGLADQLAASVKIADTALEQIRSLALNLRPAMLDDFGLAATLEWFLERQARNNRIKISFQSNLPEQLRFLQVIETVGFRVAQTAFMNIARHSQAQHVHVILNYLDESHELELIIRDDGVGFDVAVALEMAQRGRSLGLLGLQERVRLVGGWSTVKSTPGVGTEILVRLPGQIREK